MTLHQVKTLILYAWCELEGYAITCETYTEIEYISTVVQQNRLR